MLYYKFYFLPVYALLKCLRILRNLIRLKFLNHSIVAILPEHPWLMFSSTRGIGISVTLLFLLFLKKSPFLIAHCLFLPSSSFLSKLHVSQSTWIKIQACSPFHKVSLISRLSFPLSKFLFRCSKNPIVILIFPIKHLKNIINVNGCQTFTDLYSMCYLSLLTVTE